MKWDATNKTYQEVDMFIREKTECEVFNIMGQRYLGNAMKNGHFIFRGYAGNGLGSFLDGAHIELYGNAQEACGTTMSSGKIVIHGNSGDALAYGMRGGEIFVEGKCGSRCGIHMKRYQDKKSILVIGESTGDFLGEYNSGGLILVLNQSGLDFPVGRFCGIGAHGGEIIIRLIKPLDNDHYQEISQQKRKEIEDIIEHFCKLFKKDDKLLKEGYFYQVALESINPYEGLYVND